jgi:hypothetical protein
MPDSLFFDGVDDYLLFDVGQFAASGAYTFACVVKRAGADDNVYQLVMGIVGGASNGGMSHSSSSPGGQLFIWDATHNTFAADPRIGQTDGWLFLAITKGAGTVQGRIHRYSWGSPGWFHGDTSTVGQSCASPTLNGSSRVGFAGDGPSSPTWFMGNYLIGGVWDSQLSDAEIETLIGGLRAWRTLEPKEAWRLNIESAISSFALSGTSVETARSGATLDAGDAPTGWVDSFPPAVEEDNFDRADGDIDGDTTSGGGWTWASPMHSGDSNRRIVSNACAANGSAQQFDNACINHDFGSDIRVSYRITTIGGSSGDSFNVCVRIPYSAFPASFGAASDYYRLDISQLGGNDNFSVYRVLNGGFTQLTPVSGSETIPGDWAVNDEVAFECYEEGGATKLKVYRKPAAGIWALAATYSDSTVGRPTAGQKVAIEGDSNVGSDPSNWIIDNLGVETYGASVFWVGA